MQRLTLSARIHHVKIFFGLSLAKVFGALDSDRNRANRLQSDSRTRLSAIEIFAA
jgi:hypothetical protein